MYFQLATEFFEIIDMDRKEIIALKKLVPLDNKRVLGNNVIYISYRRIQGKINGLQVIIFYKNRTVTDNKVKSINLYIEICNCNQNDMIEISTSKLNKLRQNYERLHVDKSFITRMTIQPQKTSSLNLLLKIHKLKNLQEKKPRAEPNRKTYCQRLSVYHL